MWKSLLDSVVESFAMCHPVTYMHYLECKRETERQAAVTPYCESVDEYIDKMGYLQRAKGFRRHFWPQLSSTSSRQT